MRSLREALRRALGHAPRAFSYLTVAVLSALVITPFLPILNAAGQAGGAGMSVVPVFPSEVTVGQMGLPASLRIANADFGTLNVNPLTVTSIRMVPSCSDTSPDCSTGTGDPGVFRLSSTGVGEAGTACAGRVFNITVTNPANGEVTFTPQDGLPVVLQPTNNTNDLDTCNIDFTFDVLKVPAVDAQPGAPGIQTNQTGDTSGVTTDATGSVVNPAGHGNSVTTVNAAATSIATTASTPAPTVGQTSTDSATLSGPSGAAAPTGTITFTLYGPNNPTCAAGGPIQSTVTVPVNHFGPPPYTATSSTITQAGTYSWVAVYSGDANYNGATTTCNDPAETFTVAMPTPTIATTASTPPPNLGGTSTDSATLSAPAGNPAGAPAPTGTITFTLFGPNNSMCAAGGPIQSTGTVPVNHFGPPPYTFTSTPITAPGTYTWVASYSGDANYNGATTACNDPAETFTIAKPTPTIATTASTPPPGLGGTSTDSATLSAPAGVTVPPAPAPTGTITFTLFGPNNATCAAGGPIQSTATVPVDHFGPPPYTATSTPITAPGTYTWVASYSGDANYAAASTACNDPAETFAVAKPVPSIATTASTPPPAVGGTSTDSATLSAPAGVTVPPAPAPTGTITFTLFGPNNATCAAGGPVQSTATVPVDHFGPPPYTATSGTITAAGTYSWVASYSGDANYAGATTACNDPAETFTVAPPTPSIATTASTPPPAVGGTSTDSASLNPPAGLPAGAPAPTGTITFTLFGPNNATCAAGGPIVGSPITVPVNHFSPPPYTATSATITQAGTYTWVASYSGDANYAGATTACNDPAETFTVGKPTPTIQTTAASPAGLGATSTDSASLNPPAGLPAGAPTPGGTITFRLFGPNNGMCDVGGAVVGTPITVPVDHFSPPPYTATSAPVVAPGTYSWVASYSGDANYAAAATACNDPAETFTLAQAAPSIATTASTPAPNVGGTSTDSATLSAPAGLPAGAPAPTGTITFRLFGPNNATCTVGGPQVGTPITVPVNHFGPPPYTATSGTITQAGTYSWVASYSGDANYAGASTTCNDPAETFTVATTTPSIATTASTPAPFLGGTSTDSATLSGPAGLPAGAPAPTGTITFRLFGPNNATCSAAGAVVGSPITVPVDHFGPPPYTATSAAITQPGTYSWVATYSGDINYAGASTACNDPAETFQVLSATPTIATTATGPAALGGTASDAATLSAPAGLPAGAPAPTGTITFRLFGPNNPTCDAAGPIIGTPTVVPVNHFGAPPYASGASPAITTPGAYHFTAVYSGDATYAAAGPTACSDPNETFSVAVPQPTINTTATPAPIGGTSTDTATLTAPPGLGAAAPAPTGTITFTLFGPNNTTCSAAGPIVGTPITVPVDHFSPPPYTATSATITQPGTYSWVAVYSGDSNYASAASACNVPSETFTVALAAPTIVTSATPTATFGQSISDTATVNGGQNPTGTVTFQAFDNPACSGTPVFTSANRPLSGTPPTATSAPFTPTRAASYFWIATYSGDAANASVSTTCGEAGEISVLAQSTPQLTTTATPTATVGQPISDTATLTGQAPTGTITFSVFGPNNATCTGTPIFTSTKTVNGNGSYTSDPFTTTAPGTYRWIASYSGDANNGAVATTCNDANESSAVGQQGPVLTTQASAPVGVNGSITDTATLSGGLNPTGTITFTLFGPDNATCSGTPIFTSTKTVNGNGNYTSDPFTPTAPGTYRWIAAYSGDATNRAAGPTGCNEAGESTQAARATPTIVTQSSPPTAVGRPIQDVATLSGGLNPTGTITFRLFGPDNATCSGTPVFTSTRAVSGNGAYTSDPFTPTAPGTYRWIAAYSGDAANSPATTACNDANEATQVIPVPSIKIQKSVDPTTRVAPGGTFTFNVVVTNTSNEDLKITSLTDNVYGDLNGKGTCAIGATLAANGGTYRCSFTATVTADPGFTQTDTVTVIGTDTFGQTATAQAQATLTITGVPPTIQVQKTPNPTSMLAPGGSFVFTVVVTNTTPEALRITSLTDNVYGDLNGRGSCAIGAVLAASPGPGNTYTCSFTGTFTGVGGQSQTDTVTAVAVNNRGQQATAQAPATVTLTPVAPTVAITKTPNPTSRVEPGGTFTFTVVVTNTSPEAVRITSLTDNVYGDLNGQGNCAIGATLAASPGPGNTYTCSFSGSFTGPGGSSQTDTVTVKVVDTFGQTAQASAPATVRITPLPAAPPPQILARTGAEIRREMWTAALMVLFGLLLVGSTWRAARRPGFAAAGWRRVLPREREERGSVRFGVAAYRATSRPASSGAPRSPNANVRASGMGLGVDRPGGHRGGRDAGTATFGGPLG